MDSLASRKRSLTAAALVGAVVAFGAAPAFAQTPTPLPEFRTLGLGLAAADIGTTSFVNFACGTNGGPPAQALTGFADYMQCAPEAVTGLHEVYVEFNTTNSPISQGFLERQGYDAWLPRYGLTKMAAFPVALSLLFDDAGISRVFRVVSETRALPEDQERAHLLIPRMMLNYGEDGWNCTDIPAAAGEGPAGYQFINRVCLKHAEVKIVRAEERYLTNAAGALDSYARWEVFDATLPADVLPH